MMENKRTFEEQLKDLETVVEHLEEGEISLEDSLALYKKGISLIKDCESKLGTIEKEIKIIKDEALEETE